jgi:hypothetical protein
MLLDNKVTRIPFRYLLVGGMFVILLMFVFEQQIEHALELFGYNDDFVSHFPFLKNMYFNFVSSKKTTNISVVHFHMLDIALCLSIAVWGTCLTTVIINFKHYDNGFRLGLSRISERYRGRRLILYISWIFMLCGPIIVSIQPKPLADNPELRFLLTYIPRFYFFVVAQTYYLGGCFWSFSILILIWKLFWQDRPSNVILQNAQKEDAVLRTAPRPNL